LVPLTYSKKNTFFNSLSSETVDIKEETILMCQFSDSHSS